MNLKEFAQALIEKIKHSGAVEARIEQTGYCDTCYSEYAVVDFDDSQLDADIDALCAEFAAKQGTA